MEAWSVLSIVLCPQLLLILQSFESPQTLLPQSSYIKGSGLEALLLSITDYLFNSKYLTQPIIVLSIICLFFLTLACKLHEDMGLFRLIHYEHRGWHPVDAQ